MAIFNSYVKLPEGNHLVKKTRLPKRVGVIRVSFNDFTTTSLLNDDGGFSVWASRWYVAGWPARNPRLTMSKISFISQALLYVHVCFIYVAHKIVHELHAAVLEKNMLQGILAWNWNKQVCALLVESVIHAGVWVLHFLSTNS